MPAPEPLTSEADSGSTTSNTPKDWEEWTSALTGAVLGHRPPITWGGHGYGLRADHGHPRGTLALYPAHRPLSGPSYLDDLLSQRSPSTGRTLATSLLEQLHDLHIEPGRALLDQCGLVLVRVGEVRRGARGTLVTTEANARDVSLEEHGVLMDPLVVPGDSRRLDDQLMGVQLLGNLCLEADLLTRRVVWLPACLRPGDLLAFANSAGYFMDFNADHALQQPMAETVAAYQVDGEWRWCLDGQYWPTLTGEVAT